MSYLQSVVVNPELRHVRSFVVLAEELNFTRAAARLHLAQQALSAQIRQLERLLGTPLFIRTTRRVELTDAGRALLEGAPDVLAAADALFESVRDTVEGATKRLTVGFLATAFMDISTRILHAFAAEFPDVRVELRTYRLNDDRSAGVRQGETDVSIVLLPFRKHGLRTEVILTDPRVAAMPKGHGLARRRKIRGADLAGEHWFSTAGMDQVASDHWTLAAYRDGPARVGARVTDLEEYHAAIREGQIVAAPPLSMTQAYGWDDDLAIRPLVDVPPAELALCWRAKSVNPVRDDFIAVARAQAAP